MFSCIDNDTWIFFDFFPIITFNIPLRKPTEIVLFVRNIVAGCSWLWQDFLCLFVDISWESEH